MVDGDNGAVTEDAVRHAVALMEGRRLCLAREASRGGPDEVARRAHEALGQRCGEVKKGRVDVEDEARGIAHRAVDVEPLGIRKVEPLLRPRHRDKGEAPLLLHRLGRARLARGEDALIECHEEDIGELQSLGRVHRHEPNLVAGVTRILIREERRMGEVIREPRFLAAADLVLAHGLLELREVVEARLTALRAQHGLVAAPVEHFGQHLRDRRACTDLCEVIDELQERPRLCSLPDGVLDARLHGFVERETMLFCVFRQELAPPLADVALRHVDDAQEREVIAVGEQTQVRERVLDLAPREELDAAVDGIGNLRFEELFLDAARDVMRTVEHRHLAISDALCVKPCHLASQPAGLLARRARMMADDLPAMLFHGHEILLDAARVLGDQRIDDREDFRCRTVVLEHEDGLRPREVGIKV